MFLEKDKTRAQTRFNLKKKKAKARHFWCVYGHKEEVLKTVIGIHANTPAMCSCFMCGNPRNNFKGRKHGRISLKEEAFMKANDINDFLKYHYNK